MVAAGEQVLGEAGWQAGWPGEQVGGVHAGLALRHADTLLAGGVGAERGDAKEQSVGLQDAAVDVGGANLQDGVRAMPEILKREYRSCTTMMWRWPAALSGRGPKKSTATVWKA